jgi:hypothetical protein
MDSATNNNTPRELKNAREIQSVTHQRSLWAEQRNSAIADEFIRLEVQIATIIFAFTSLFAGNFNQNAIDNFSPLTLTLMKVAFTFSVACLLLSLAFGLLHLKTHESFWDSMLRQRLLRYGKWCEVTENDLPYEEAKAYHEGTSMNNGVVVSAPEWTWILQTICLGLSVVTLFILMVVFLFN